MKLYIPTSTLNFNNILSTESLSPQAFYGERGFGYRRWTPVPENGLANAITLYGRPFRFDRPASDVEDHPMWVEVETDEEFAPVADGVRLADHTLYLTPWRTRFLFLTEADRRTTRSLAQQSAETKLIPLYVQRMAVRTDLGASTPVNSSKDDVLLNTEAIESDRRINRMKGLLYGYYLGALLSETPAIANRRRQLHAIRNDFTALWSASALNQTGIKALYRETQEMFDHLWKEELTLPNVFNAWWEDEWERLDLRAATERRLLPTRDEEIVVADGRLAKIAPTVLPDERENNLFLTWANEVLTCLEYADEPNTFRATLSDALTAAARDLLGTDWETSPLRTQLNAMRRLVRNEENNFRWTNAITTAAAAVLLWGDDWERLRTQLRERCTTDFRLAFALYGELTGFANLTRDLTDHLFELENRTYVADVYKDIYGQLHGTAADLPDGATGNPIAVPENLDAKFIITSPTPKTNLPTEDFAKLVWNIWESMKAQLKRDKAKLETGLHKALQAMAGSDDPKHFLDLLAKQEKWGKKSKAWIEMEARLCPKHEDRTFEFTQAPRAVPPQRFPFDYAHVDEIAGAIKERLHLPEKVWKPLKSDLKYVLDPKYTGGKDAKQLLTDFADKLKDGKEKKTSKNGKDLTWKVKQYAQLDIPAIIAYIRENFEV